jgi:hypothetical protein
MRDLWDLEFARVDLASGIGTIAAVFLTVFAYSAGWGWWSAAVFLLALWINLAVVHRIERRYDRIRLEMELREDDELNGLGWNSRKEAAAHLKTCPLYWRKTWRPISYINKNGHQRWGVCNKPRYWRDADAQLKMKAKYPPTPAEQRMMDGMREKLISEARDS